MTLEEKTDKAEERHLRKREYGRVYRWGVDVASAWLYFTPTYALQNLSVEPT